jgi:hypothetical protein
MALKEQLSKLFIDLAELDLALEIAPPAKSPQVSKFVIAYALATKPISVYGFYEAKTTFGRIGVKVWIYKGDAAGTKVERDAAQAAARMAQRQRPARSTRPRRDDAPAAPAAAASEAPASEAAVAVEAPVATEAPATTSGTEA